LILQLLDYAGVAVFAVSGALAAGRKSLDLLGVVVIATAASIGGGTLRDLLLDRHPVFWIAEPTYILVIVGAALLTIPYTRLRVVRMKNLQVADALGLALFSISGAQVAESAQPSGLIVVVMATITASFGGVLRDVLCNEVPLILRKGQIYATAVIVGASLYVIVIRLGLPRLPATLISMVTVAGLRLGAITWGWSLPVFSLDSGEREPPR
jgi:uncharacterized membrane protein YeiH